MFPVRISLAVVLPLVMIATVASAQNPALERTRALQAQAQRAPATPGVPPSLGAEIDQMLGEVPGGARRAPGARETVGQEIDRVMGARPGAAPSARRNVRAGIRNRTRHNILVVQMTPVDRPEWTANLVRQRFNPGVTLTWLATDGCRYDVRITFDAGNEFTRFDHDFCAQERITLTDIDAAELPAARERVTFYRLVNRTGAVVYHVHATPAGNAEPGPDLLGQWVMAEGDHYTGRVPRSGSCLYDLRITFSADGNEAMTLPRQNLCESPNVVLSRRSGPQG